MADEDVTAGEVQAPAGDLQAESAPIDEASAFVEEVAPSVEASPGEDALEEPVAEADAPASDSDDDPATEPVLLTEAELERQYGDILVKRENTAAQKREAELRKQSATEEATRDFTAKLKKRLLENPDDPLDGTGFIRENAEGNVAMGFFAEYAQAAGDLQGLNEAQMAAMRASMEIIETPRAMQAFAKTHMAAATEMAREQGSHGKSVDDLLATAPSDSLFAQSMQARDKAKVDAALQAAKLEARPAREPQPESGVGQPVGTTPTFDLNDPLDVSRAWRAGYFESDADALEALNKAWSK